MYAILHLPTNLLLGRGKAPCGYFEFNGLSRDIKPDTLYYFYSKTDAEKYRRAFLVCIYSMKSNELKFIYPPIRARFLKNKNKKHVYHLQERSFKIGLASIKWHPIIQDPKSKSIKIESADDYVIIDVMPQNHKQANYNNK